ncbi:hypothetical protein L3Y34_000943 [Caenorhabditis briggsae]|uniref:Uncharacterized protein n=1 Tax=Caenorhabditis briggsae TaxID=6238 RepID=A0AAE9DAX6_CAEBR|nr:hypothetical protein L3Y34_000943 [Caenorhabditis briggsae]
MNSFSCHIKSILSLPTHHFTYSSHSKFQIIKVIRPSRGDRFTVDTGGISRGTQTSGMTLRNQKGDVSSSIHKNLSPSFSTRLNTSKSAPFAIMSVELPPGLPTITNPVFNEFSPPAHIPFSGFKQHVVNTVSHNNQNGSVQKNNHQNQKSEKSRYVTPKKEVNRNPTGNGATPNTCQNSNNTKSMQPFQWVSPLPFAMNSVPIRGIKNEQGIVKYPLLLCSQEGTLMISMAAGVIVELCLDRSFRVVCNTDFMAYVNSNGSVSSILHKYAKIVHGKEHVHCKFLNSNDRMAVLGPEGILFSMDSLTEAYLLSSAHESGPSASALEKPEFPIQNMDYTIQQMYLESNIGAANNEKCDAIMQKAKYEKYPDGTLIVHINGMLLKSNSQTGEVTIEAKPIKLSVNPTTLTAQLRSAHIDMAIQDKDKCYVKRGDKRIHTSRSGMVVSDGTCTISMDQFGRILACS